MPLYLVNYSLLINSVLFLWCLAIYFRNNIRVSTKVCFKIINQYQRNTFSEKEEKLCINYPIHNFIISAKYIYSNIIALRSSKLIKLYIFLIFGDGLHAKWKLMFEIEFIFSCIIILSLYTKLVTIVHIISGINLIKDIPLYVNINFFLQNLLRLHTSTYAVKVYLQDIIKWLSRPKIYFVFFCTNLIVHYIDNSTNIYTFDYRINMIFILLFKPVRFCDMELLIAKN